MMDLTLCYKNKKQIQKLFLDLFENQFTKSYFISKYNSKNKNYLFSFKFLSNMPTLKINIFSFLSSWAFPSSKKRISTSANTPKKRHFKENKSEENKSKEPREENNPIYYLPVHLM